MIGINRLAQPHVVISSHRVVIRFEVYAGADVEVHAATNVLHHQAIAARTAALEVDVPHVGANQGFATCLLRRCRSRLPKLHGSRLLLLACLHIVEKDLASLPRLVVALAAIAQPLVQVGSLYSLRWRVADDVHVDGFRRRIPDVEADARRCLVAAKSLRYAHGIGVALPHRLRQLQEQPVIEFTLQQVVGLHGLTLTPDSRRDLRGKRRIVGRAHLPRRSLLSGSRVQPFAKHQQRVVTLGKRMAQIGTRPRAVVAVMYLAIPEVHHQVILVNNSHSHQLSSADGDRRQQQSCQSTCAIQSYSSHDCRDLNS